MKQRYLLLQPSLDQYEELWLTRQERYNSLYHGWIDVTGDPAHEKLFKLSQAQK